MFGAIFESLLGWETVARTDIVEIYDLDREALGNRVFHYVSTPSCYRDEYLVHPELPPELKFAEGYHAKRYRVCTAGLVAPGKSYLCLRAQMKQRHSQKPEELYDMIEHCSPAPFLELFARSSRRGWTQWGDEIPPGRANIAKESVTPRPMEGGMIRPYRMPQLPLPLH